MLPRDTDPFSPTRKKSDPFEEVGYIFSKLEPFEFEFNNPEREDDKTRRNTTTASTGSPPRDADAQGSQDILTGHLQVSLPPEGIGSGNEGNQTQSSIRSRPVPSSSTMVGTVPLGAPTSLLKQQTVDVISSISNKKMPHLFGQSSRFPKRDSNSINMRRLQESDSLSETETAPEPPPRPDSATYSEPPPLPPKKQFNDIVIRPRVGTSSSTCSSNRYESVTTVLASKLCTTSRTSPVSGVDVPPIPLPSRRVGRTDGSYPGPGRPRKPGHTEDDYLAPLATLSSNPANTSVLTNPDVPPLLPPPTQISSRSRTHRQQSFNQSAKSHDIYENKHEILQQQLQQQQQQQQQLKNSSEPALVPDIPLSQLLTLGIDELSAKLNVPTSKLSTMTLVELTSYLAEFLEQSKPAEPKPEAREQQQSVFKVNFDQEATFVAKFDDTFGEDFQQPSSSSFEANFAEFDRVQVEPAAAASQQISSVPPADRYAVFREIIDQELQQQQEQVDLIGDVVENTEDNAARLQEKQFETNFSLTSDLDIALNSQDLLSGDMPEVSGHQATKIDTKISEVLAQAKDRYAALRDLILVENLFDNPPPQAPAPGPPPGLMEISDSARSDSKSPFQGFSGFNDDDEDQDLKQLMDQSVNLDPSTQQQRLGLVDSRGFLVEPSSSAITVEDEEEEEEERRAHREDKDDQGCASSGDSNEKENDKDNLPVATYEQLASSNQQLEEIEEKTDKIEETPKISITQSLTITNENNYQSTGSVVSSALSGSKDDLEIDDLMQRAISNLSLDSRDRNSPAVISNHNLLTTTAGQQQTTNSATTTMTPQHFNDVSTSPIPMQRSPVPSSITTQAKSPQQLSPLPSHLNVVSQIIDAATRQIQTDNVSKTSNESWATFDTPQHQPMAISSDKRARPSAKALNKTNNFLNLPPPPGSTSNCSQNDSALESPCSSDPRDEGWNKHAMGGSSLSLGHHSTMGSTSGQRRFHKKDRQNTSSSSRDLSWDEDQGVAVSGHIMDYPQAKRVTGQSQGNLTTERLGYYRRHARRMNSCDEDYE